MVVGLEAVAVAVGVGAGAGAGVVGGQESLSQCRQMFSRTLSHMAGKDNLKDGQGHRAQAGAELLRHGWVCTTCPNDKFAMVMPSNKECVMRILDMDIFAKNQQLKSQMEQNLRFALALQPGQADLMKQTIATDLASHKQFFSIMMLFFARALPGSTCEDSPFASETIEEVSARVAAFGCEYKHAARKLEDFGIDGSYLAEEGLSEAELEQDFEVVSRLQRKRLLQHFAKYKPLQKHFIAIGFVASCANFEYAGRGLFTRALSHEEINLAASTMMAYRSAASLLSEPSCPDSKPCHLQLAEISQLAQGSQTGSWEQVSAIDSKDLMPPAKCFLPDYAFRGAEGQLLLSQLLKGGDILRSEDKDTPLVKVSEVVEYEATGAGHDVVKLSTAQGTFAVSASHRVVIPGGSSIPAADLKKGDVVLVGAKEQKLLVVAPQKVKSSIYGIKFEPDLPIQAFPVARFGLLTMGETHADSTSDVLSLCGETEVGVPST
ncbi:unnamed protein product [Effrenium voratum]|uniref:Hint domain-containing protein n=1 Tax=Effrenium voratum TaxID=2562239 RepID=A0AA36IYX1_9DINO|nr:unnamed protein product [Effrenium voratum]